MTVTDYKELKRALWEIEMKKERKGDIPYLEYNDIMEIVLEQRATGGKINLSPEAFDFYKADFQKVLGYLEQQEKKDIREKAADFRIQVEKDKETAIQIILKQNANIPYQVRKSEEEIRQTVKQVVGNRSSGDLSYRADLAKLCGGKLKEDKNTIDIDQRVLDERMIQKDYEGKLAEAKVRADSIAKGETPKG